MGECSSCKKSILDKIKDMFLRLNRHLYNMDVVTFILSIILMQYLSVIIVSPLIMLFPDNNAAAPFDGNEAKEVIFIVGVIMAPLFETLIYQKLIIDICDKIKWFNNRKYIGILASGAIFGSRHTYSPRYIVHMFVIGSIWAYAYTIYKQKKKHPYWVVCCIHAINNFIALMII
ncbi:CPBP family intramembrane glutamic endopeptidase [Tepidibacter aestuarii]|uniref:CPBP family intramembrane glutamic endopeptidase n=1 Tax=Tepidibacter aestuarii TaxID=2925782 RepID=UPI0020BF3AFA|nr:CPBP family intramembrane glutamic endopeptidase [Tepidibacter aestuarii]CAH2212061.1 CAAX protease self-immunity [Tepidibacter aestuarii]